MKDATLRRSCAGAAGLVEVVVPAVVQMTFTQ